MKQIVHNQENLLIPMDNRLLWLTWALEAAMETIMSKLVIEIVKQLTGVIGVLAAKNVELDIKGEQNCLLFHLYPIGKNIF